MSPPPRHAIKAPSYVDLPTEWIRLYVRTAVDLGFMKPSGPAYYIDLNSIAFGEGHHWDAGWVGCSLLWLMGCTASGSQAAPQPVPPC